MLIANAVVIHGLVVTWDVIVEELENPLLPKGPFQITIVIDKTLRDQLRRQPGRFDVINSYDYQAVVPLFYHSMNRELHLVFGELTCQEIVGKQDHDLVTVVNAVRHVFDEWFTGSKVSEMYATLKLKLCL